MGLLGRAEIIAVKPAAGIGAPVALAVLWAIFGSPKARVQLQRDPAYLLFELAWFGAGAVAFAATAGAVTAIVFGVSCLANLALLRAWHQYPTGGPQPRQQDAHDRP